MSEQGSGRRILLGIGGGIAAYKAVQVASSLYQAGHTVCVAMTRAATQFVTPLSFAGVIRRRVVTDMFAPPSTDEREDIYPHLYPATEAEVFMLVPATANLIGKVANGIGDDVVTTAALSLPAGCRRYLCPAMNVEMWRQGVVQANLATLRGYGWQCLGPAAGHLACGTVGEGRMLEAADIVARIQQDLAATADLAGKRVLVLSGPTVEHLDPVRFLSNHSSGKMGQAIAETAASAGATVEFVTGPVPPANLPSHPAITITRIVSAAELLVAAADRFPAADIVVYVAAVADYTVAQPAAAKLPKHADGLTLDLLPTPDIAATLCREKRRGQLCFGFALETDNGLAKARSKLRRKHLDGIVLNGVDSFGAESGEFTLVTTDQAEPQSWGRLGKRECARRLIAAIAARLGR
jgi:phosphopantothenoylcysteine decarboxylase/phosphopantothenate--cysteine ligase